MSGYNHEEIMETMIERERDMEIALKGFRARGYGLGSPEVSICLGRDPASTTTFFHPTTLAAAETSLETASEAPSIHRRMDGGGQQGRRGEERGRT